MHTDVLPKDVVTAFMGASGGLVGLGLVFLGLVATALQSLPGAVPPPVRGRYRRMAVSLALPAVLGIACLVLAAAWLVLPKHPHSLYLAVMTVFFVQISSLGASAVYVVKALLWA